MASKQPAAKAAAAPAAKSTAAPAAKATAAPAAKTAPASAASKTAAPAQKTAAVPETILKKRRTTEQVKAHEKKKRTALRKKHVTSRRVIFKRAEQYIKEYRSQERQLVRFRRQAKAAGNFFVEPDARLALVVRIRGINQIHPKPRKILQLLRLRQINNTVFVRLNKATLQMLKLVEPYVTYGYPNQKTVKELIYKRGFGKIDKQRVAITDNAVIERKLGKHGIICIEDLIHQIYTVGPRFKQANKFLWPFKLNPPRGGFNKVTTHYTEGGDAGNREDKINALVRRMN